MKNILIGGIVLVALLAVGWYVMNTYTEKEPDQDPDNGARQVLISKDFGFSIEYPGDPEEYEIISSDEAIRGDRVFFRAWHRASDLPAPTDGEGPPTIAVEVFRNPMNLSPEEWIRSHESSNFQLAVSDEIETETIGGHVFTTYQWDGLYRADAYVHARAGYLYLFSVQFIDAEDGMREDARTMLATVSWSEPEVLAQVAHGDIRITTPVVDATAASPLVVEGEARGFWLFEATAPIAVVDWDGRIIGEGYIEAQDEWMTEAFVPVRGTVTFTPPPDTGDFSRRGTLIVQKANASGLPEHDDAIEIPIRFESTGE